MDQAEFEQAYADRSGVTVEWLHEHGRSGVPCDCDDSGCEGWQMAHADEVPARVLPEQVEIEGRLFTRVCGFPISGMFMTFPCCLEPNHQEGHVFAAYYAEYYLEAGTGAVFEHRG